jgi:hypothetical protein
LEHLKLRVVNVLKHREYVNAKRTLQRVRQELAREERARRQDFAQDMEMRVMAANQVRADDFAFTKDVLPLEADPDAPRAPPTLLLPCIQEQLGLKPMDEGNVDEDDVDVDDEDQWFGVNSN